LFVNYEINQANALSSTLFKTSPNGSDTAIDD